MGGNNPSPRATHREAAPQRRQRPECVDGGDQENGTAARVADEEAERDRDQHRYPNCDPGTAGAQESEPHAGFAVPVSAVKM